LHSHTSRRCKQQNFADHLQHKRIFLASYVSIAFKVTLRTVSDATAVLSMVEDYINDRIEETRSEDLKTTLIVEIEEVVVQRHITDGTKVNISYQHTLVFGLDNSLDYRM
jgi:hypothetical protein